MKHRIINWSYFGVGILPILWLILLTITYFKAGAAIGHLPKYADQYATQFNMFMPYDSIPNIFLMACSLFGMFIIPILTFIHFIISRLLTKFQGPNLKNILVGNMGYVLVYIFGNFDPMSQMVTWYVD